MHTYMYMPGMHARTPLVHPLLMRCIYKGFFPSRLCSLPFCQMALEYPQKLKIFRVYKI